MSYDLKNMESWEVIHAAIEMSGLTRKEVASRLGVSVSHINRYCSREDPHEPSLDKVRALCRATGNFLLLSWVEAKLDVSENYIAVPENRAQVLTALARAVASLGDASRLAADTENRGIAPSNARDIRAALVDVIDECRYVMGMLQHLAEHQDVTTCTPLASLRSVRKPWWKLW